MDNGIESRNGLMNTSGAIERAQMTAASMAAALLLSAGPADAGVIMAQPKLQKVNDER